MGLGATAPTTRPAFLVGKVDDKTLCELSGLAASRRLPGVLWGHNDSGNRPEIFALGRTGKVLAKFDVEGAPNVDWEDIATDDAGHLYLSDTGNNDRTRREVYVYRLPEPRDLGASKKQPIRADARWTIRYPGRPFDCEALCVVGRYGYVIPKLRNFAAVPLFRFPLTEGGGVVTLEEVCKLPVKAPVTGMDVSPDGKWLGVLTVFGPSAFRIDGDMSRAGRMETGSATFVAPVIEACTWVDEGFLTGTEPGELMLFTWDDLGVRK